MPRDTSTRGPRGGPQHRWVMGTDGLSDWEGPTENDNARSRVWFVRRAGARAQAGARAPAAKAKGIQQASQGPGARARGPVAACLGRGVAAYSLGQGETSLPPVFRAAFVFG